VASLTPFMSCFNHKSSLEDLVCSSTSTTTTTTTTTSSSSSSSSPLLQQQQQQRQQLLMRHGHMTNTRSSSKAHGVFVCTPWESSTAALMGCPVPPTTPPPPTPPPPPPPLHTQILIHIKTTPQYRKLRYITQLTI